MPIILQPEHERMVAAALRSGTYQNSDEVIQRALELLNDRDTWLAENRAKIEEGYAAAQRGELMDAAEVRARMEEKKRAWGTEERPA
jgi:putative addiction module CopG family antidote